MLPKAVRPEPAEEGSVSVVSVAGLGFFLVLGLESAASLGSEASRRLAAHTRSLWRRVSGGCMDELMDLGELLKEGFQVVERDLVGAVGEGFGRVGVGLDEDAVAACGDGGAGEDGGEDAVATGAGALAAGALDGVGCVENGAMTEFTHPV